MKINQIRSYCYSNGKENINSNFQFIKLQNGSIASKELLLIIDIEQEQLKIVKPENIF